MKKKLFAIILILLIPAMASAFNSSQGSTGSGEQTADATIYTGKCWITGLHIITDGTNNAKVIIYDNTAASGTVRWEQTVIGGDHYGGRTWTFPKRFDTGITVDVSGTGASYIVEYTR